MTEAAPDKIRLDGVYLPCIVGVLPEERGRPQRVRLDLEVTLDVTSAALSGELERTLDYAAMSRELSFILEAGEFRLLETAALGLCAYVHAQEPLTLGVVGVTLTKPDALAGRGVPSVTVRRGAAELERYRARRTSVLFSSPDAVVQRFHQSAVAPHERGYPKARELELGHGQILRVSTP